MEYDSYQIRKRLFVDPHTNHTNRIPGSEHMYSSRLNAVTVRPSVPATYVKKQSPNSPLVPTAPRPRSPGDDTSSAPRSCPSGHVYRLHRQCPLFVCHQKEPLYCYPQRCQRAACVGRESMRRRVLGQSWVGVWRLAKICRWLCSYEQRHQLLLLLLLLHGDL